MAKSDGTTDYFYFISSMEGDQIIKEIMRDQEELQKLRELQDKLREAKLSFKRGDVIHRAVYEILVELTDGQDAKA